MTAIFVSGIIGLGFTSALWAYLRLRVRQLERGIEQTRQYGAVALELACSDMPEEQQEHIVTFNRMIGSGHVADWLLRRLFSGQLNTPITRDRIAAQRAEWTGVSRSTRLKYVQAVFTGLLADSYSAGLRGTLFRRAFFYVSSDPAEIAKALDAFETKVLIVGAESAAERSNEKLQGERDDHLVPA